MPSPIWSPPSRRPLPIILIRGFGGLDVDDEKALAYQGFNDGSVYPQKRGENYIYEGLILRLMKSNWRYYDATNVVGYYSRTMQADRQLPDQLAGLDPGFFKDSKVVIDVGMAVELMSERVRPEDLWSSLWVFRYYDLSERTFELYGQALVRLIDFIRALMALKQPGSEPKVNIIAHSMGGLIVREAVQRTFPERAPDAADRAINKIVTLGTPHCGITFQILQAFKWLPLDAGEELWAFNPKLQANDDSPVSYKKFGKHFPLERLLTVVGTNYRSYGVRAASWLNRLFSVGGEFGPNYNRSDGLVQQTSAQIEGAPRTFVHKCHGGFDSLVTARESFEIAMRFFKGNVRARLNLLTAKVHRGGDFFGKSEFFFGVSIKPRGVDFELFHQSKEAENCYGPFAEQELTDPSPAFGWAGPRRRIWEGWLNAAHSMTGQDLVLRAEFYVGERDVFGVGFSDNVVFHKQYYLRALAENGLELFLYEGEQFARAAADARARSAPLQFRDGAWTFRIGDDGFEATLGIELDFVPEQGEPVPMRPTRGNGKALFKAANGGRSSP